ncbi:MrpH family fimbial adhesin [Serratia nematodiphila]|uniref:MrpH family fimbial adhesin n=1 Tax=Serratia nematodiphila TaxID=458197 RepID=UPI0020C8A97E|nr:hypothetical protein [Serratia nematodiphila]UTO01795.1 hypothetical protein NLX84_01445 [Serratia nematodiphila]
MVNTLTRLNVVRSFFILLLLYTSGAWAGWSSDIRFSPREKQYFAKVTYWDIGDVTPNPLYGCSYLCSVTFWVVAAGTTGSPMNEVSFPGLTTSKTMGELAQSFANSGFFNREFYSRKGFPDKNVCVFFGYWGKISGGNGSYGPARFPGGMQCVPPVVDPSYCDLAEKEIELRHGVLRDEEVNGQTVSTSLHVTCSSKYPVRNMSADRDGSVYFNGGKQFRSELKIDGKDLGEGKVVEATPQGVTLTLSSTLMGYDGSIGVFQGSKAIIVSLP